jgi:hypothetical protein
MLLGEGAVARGEVAGQPRWAKGNDGWGVERAREGTLWDGIEG